jgi:hypothetical protein
MRLLKRRLIAALLLNFAALSFNKAYGFNLFQDIKTQTEWTLGKQASVGTGYDFTDKQMVLTELAGLASYRFVSLWYGIAQLPQPDKTTKWTDTGKLGFNLAYLLKGFTNQPPDIIKSLVIGPAISIPVFTSPHRVAFLVDVNYVFGGSPAKPSSP